MDDNPTPKFLVQVHNRFATEIYETNNPAAIIAGIEASIAKGYRKYAVFPWSEALMRYYGPPKTLPRPDNGKPYEGGAL